MKKQIKKAFILLEILLGLSILGIFLTGILSTIIYGEENKILASKRTTALLRAQDGIEIARNIRDRDFSKLTDGFHGVAKINGVWEFSGTSDTDENFEFPRTIIVETIDSTTKKITSSVSWEEKTNKTGTLVLTTYLTNWRRIINPIGNWSGNGGGGAVVTGRRNLTWLLPYGLKVKTKGNYAFVSVDVGLTGNFIVIDISEKTNPIIVNQSNVPWIPLDLDIEGNFAYVATTNTSREIQIVDISTPTSPIIMETINVPGGSGANGIDVVGDYIYLIQFDGYFSIIDKNTREVLSTQDLGEENKDIFVQGNYAYIATQDNSQELKIIDISNKQNPIQVGSLNISGDYDGRSITGYDDRILLGRISGGLSLIDVSNRTAPILLQNINLGNTVRDMDLANENKYAFTVTANSVAEFQLVEIFNNQTLEVITTLDLNRPLNSVDYSETLDLAITVGEDWVNELIVIGPQE